MTPAFDAGHLALVRESLVAVVNEMRANVIRASYSSIIYEGHDFSCALVAADGRLVAQGADDNPIHIFAVPYSAAEIVRAFGDDINEGDIFLHNDPYTGGTHLNDVLMLHPVFCGGRLAMFTATRCHWGDVGGMTPGSLSGRVREIYQEGMRITPTRIASRGTLNEAFLTLLFDNMRIRHEREGDFKTMLGTSRKAVAHVERLFERFGGDALLAAVEQLVSGAEAHMRERIAAVPDGTWHAQGWLDNNGHDDRPLKGCLTLTIKGDRLIADFTGSSPQTPGPVNVGPAMAFNAVASVVKSFLDPTTPVNHGSFNPLTIVNPAGSFLNATLPAPCGGMVECRALMVGLTVAALGQAVPTAIAGDLKGGANHMYISGTHPEHGGLFLLYEYPAGGTGATCDTDGVHAVRAFPEGDFNAVQSAEVLESQSPLRVEYYGLREGSCGDGEHRGGLGLRRDIRVLVETANLSVLADKNVLPPFGVNGGCSGAANRFVVVRDGEEREPSPMPGKVGGYALERGDVVRIETAGGGGHGDPLRREPSLVASDVADGVIDARQAHERYGVVLSAAKNPGRNISGKKFPGPGWSGEGTIDESATDRLRTDIAARRVRLELALDEAPADAGDPREWLRLGHAAAGRLSASDGDLVELVPAGAGASVRAWARVDGDQRLALVSAAVLEALGAQVRDVIEIRTVARCPQ